MTDLPPGFNQLIAAASPQDSPFARAGWTETTNRPTSWHNADRDRDDHLERDEEWLSARDEARVMDGRAADEWASREGSL